MVLSKLDYGNAILAGLPNTVEGQLHGVLNTAAKLVTGARMLVRATPLLINLHWLPVEAGILLKGACMTHRLLGRARNVRSVNQWKLETPLFHNTVIIFRLRTRHLE